MLSSSELEYRQGDTTYVCKYSKELDVLRVVIQRFGTVEALYYKITLDGLKERNGNIIYSPSKYLALKQSIQVQQKFPSFCYYIQKTKINLSIFHSIHIQRKLI